MSQPLPSAGSHLSKLLAISVISVVVGLCAGLVMHPYLFPRASSQNLPSSVNQVVVTVDYNGQWAGGYIHTQVKYGDWVNAYASLPSTLTLWSGNESETVTLTRPFLQTFEDTMWVVWIGVSKSDSTANLLTVKIAKPDGTTLVEASNSSSSAYVNVGYYFLGDYGQILELLPGYDDEALTFTFMGTEQLEIQGATWGGTSGDAANTITVSVQNTGTMDLTVDKYKLGVGGTAVDITDVPVTQGDTASVVCTNVGWTSGTTYDIYLITSTGKQFPYRATAP